MAGCNYIKKEHRAKIMESLSKTGKYAKRNMAYFAYALTTGFRVAEILTLSRKDIILKNGKRAETVTVPASLMKGKYKSRTKDLEPFAIEYLDPWLIQQEYDMNLNQGWQSVFCQSNGKTIQYDCIRKILKTAFSDAGLSETDRLYSTHSLRKTFAYAVQQAGIEKGLNGLELLQYISEELGHSDLKSTEKYIASIDPKKKALKKEKKKQLNNLL